MVLLIAQSGSRDSCENRQTGEQRAEHPGVGLEVQDQAAPEDAQHGVSYALAAYPGDPSRALEPAQQATGGVSLLAALSGAGLARAAGWPRHRPRCRAGLDVARRVVAPRPGCGVVVSLQAPRARVRVQSPRPPRPGRPPTPLLSSFPGQPQRPAV